MVFMDRLIRVKVLMNSTCEDALGWKCCNLQGMNLEIHVENTGVKYVRVKSEVDLVGDGDTDRVGYLYPHGIHPIAPDEALSFYCSYDEQRFRNFSHIVVRDESGRKFRAAITGGGEAAEIVEPDQRQDQLPTCY
jgi:hypothetical protein